MSMISEQVKRLRKLANQWKHNDVAGCNLIFEACDTIEALAEPKTNRQGSGFKRTYVLINSAHAVITQYGVAKQKNITTAPIAERLWSERVVSDE